MSLDDFLSELDMELEHDQVVVFVHSESTVCLKCAKIVDRFLCINSSYYVPVPIKAAGYAVFTQDVLPLTEHGISMYIKQLYMQRFKTKLKETTITFPKTIKHTLSRFA